METQSQVFTVEVAFEGKTYTASYLVEHDIIQANIAARIMSTPLTDMPAEETVKALLLERIQQQNGASP